MRSPSLCWAAACGRSSGVERCVVTHAKAGLLVVVPPGRWLFDLGYRLLASNRQRISAVCRLTPKQR